MCALRRAGPLASTWERSHAGLEGTSLAHLALVSAPGCTRGRPNKAFSRGARLPVRCRDRLEERGPSVTAGPEAQPGEKTSYVVRRAERVLVPRTHGKFSSEEYNNVDEHCECVLQQLLPKDAGTTTQLPQVTFSASFIARGKRTVLLSWRVLHADRVCAVFRVRLGCTGCAAHGFVRCCQGGEVWGGAQAVCVFRARWPCGESAIPLWLAKNYSDEICQKGPNACAQSVVLHCANMDENMGRFCSADARSYALAGCNAWG
eukprot:1633073-Amphidinium_carterae.1